jgi:hypothetical protein
MKEMQYIWIYTSLNINVAVVNTSICSAGFNIKYHNTQNIYIYKMFLCVSEEIMAFSPNY